MDLIDRKALIERMNEFAAFAVSYKPYMSKDDIVESVLKQAKETALRLVKEAPTIEVAPVVHGEWIKETVLSKCSVCGFRLGADTYRYCPNCGAKMRTK